jgi:hypothetical protein
MHRRPQHARRVHEIHVRQGRKRGMAWAIIDGHFLLDTPDRRLATNRPNKAPVIVGANDRDIGLGLKSLRRRLRNTMPH